jgi:hypothetical protein
MILLAKVGIGIGATLALTAGWVFHEGVIRVDVDEARPGGSHVHFWLPATTVSAGMHLAPRHCLQQAAGQSRPFLPVIREVAKELAKYPNAELLDVHDKSNHVRMVVRNGRLYLDAVTEDGDNVHISFPAETLRDVADGLEDAAPGVWIGSQVFRWDPSLRSR